MNSENNIKIDDLITIFRKLEEYIQCLDCKNTEHRQLAVKTIEEYIKKFVTPALYLMPHMYLEDIFEREIMEMCLSAEFSSKREDLTRPSDEELDYVIEGIIDVEPTVESRNKFWDCWLLNESYSCIAKLWNFLEDPLIPTRDKQIKPDVLSREIKQIEYISNLEMHPNFEYWIERILRWEQKALAAWNEEEESTS